MGRILQIHMLPILPNHFCQGTFAALAYSQDGDGGKGVQQALNLGQEVSGKIIHIRIVQSKWDGVKGVFGEMGSLVGSE